MALDPQIFSLSKEVWYTQSNILRSSVRMITLCINEIIALQISEMFTIDFQTPTYY